MNKLNWSDFDCCVYEITKKCKNKNFIGVYGFPRGGLCLAVALSHSLNIPLITKPSNYSLIVDDIYETGTTLEAVRYLLGSEMHVWISKKTPTWWYSYKCVRKETWIVFPWENINNAIQEKETYYQSRN